jgi:DNA-binding transcriptional LysR family regulator
MLIRSMRAFLALHRYGTVVAAAEQVHLSQAAVSVQMKSLERELGVALFVRTKRSIKLTPAGHRLVPLAERMVATYEEMRALDGPHTVAGVLSLGVITSALSGVLPGLLRRITLENPQLEVKIIAGISNDLVEQVDAGVLDAAIVTQPPETFSTRLMARHLYAEPFVVIAHSSMRHMDVPAILAAAPYVRFDRRTWAGMQIEQYVQEQGLQVRPGVELNSLDAITVMVSEGLGVSIVPLVRGASWHRKPTLHITPLPNFHRPVSLVERPMHARSTLTAALRSSFEHLPPVSETKRV